jgi:hypothetical protein
MKEARRFLASRAGAAASGQVPGWSASLVPVPMMVLPQQ